MSVSLFKVFQSTRPQFIEEVFYLGLWLVVRTWIWIQHMSEQVQENLLKIVFTFEKISFSFYLFLFSFPFSHFLHFLSFPFSSILFVTLISLFLFYFSILFQFQFKVISLSISLLSSNTQSFRVSFLVTSPFHKLFTFFNLFSSLTFLFPLFFL